MERSSRIRNAPEADGQQRRSGLNARALAWRASAAWWLSLSPLCGQAPQRPTFPGPNAQEFRAFSQQMDQMFEQFFGESDDERQRLEEVVVSPEEERQVGRERFDQFREQLAHQRVRLLHRGRDVDYLRALVRSLQTQMSNHDRYPTIDVYVWDIDDTEAGSLPGGIVVVTRGLLEFAPNEAAIAGALAHELAHIDRGHQLDTVRRLKLLQQSLAAGSPPQRFAENGLVIAKGFARPFRPDQETEADADATRWLVQAGYDPLQWAALFDRLHERDAAKQALPMPTFFRSHPYHADRSRAIRDLSGQLVDSQRLYRGQLNLTRRIPASRQRFPAEWSSK